MEFLQHNFSWPMWPVTILLCLVTAYWVLVILGGLDMDFLGFDLDIDPGLDGHQSILEWGLASFRWLNLGDVPLMLWMSVFAIAAWLTGSLLDRHLTDPTTQQIVLSILRNFGVGLVAAKVFTQPLKGKFRILDPNPAAGLVGRTVTVWTYEVTPTSGQAHYATRDGAPLLLNVRSVEGNLAKGTLAEIVEYSTENNVYYVRQVEA